VSPSEHARAPGPWRKNCERAPGSPILHRCANARERGQPRNFEPADRAVAGLRAPRRLRHRARRPAVHERGGGASPRPRAGREDACRLAAPARARSRWPDLPPRGARSRRGHLLTAAPAATLGQDRQAGDRGPDGQADRQPHRPDVLHRAHLRAPDLPALRCAQPRGAGPRVARLRGLVPSPGFLQAWGAWTGTRG